MDQYRKLQADAKTQHDYENASKYLQELTNCNNIEAMTELGLCYKYNYTILGRSATMSKYWLTKAAKQGHPVAMYEYGLTLCVVEEKTSWLKKAFETGNSYVLGDMYGYEIYVEQDHKKSTKNYLKSDDLRALFIIGNIYYYGYKGNVIDLTKAFEYYLKSANTGYSFAQYKVAMCYRLGEGIEKNLTKAYNWCKRAVNQNYMPAGAQLEKDIFKNFDRHENARNALLCLITIRKFRKDPELLNKVPIEIVIMIAKEIWKTKNDVKWTLNNNEFL